MWDLADVFASNYDCNDAWTKMTVHFRKKVRKQRGSRKHGWGRVCGHWASGQKGGKGNAGLFKHKWTWVVKYDPDYFGKHGFSRWWRLASAESKALNIDDIEKSIDQYRENGVLQEEKGLLKIDLEKIGYGKLLSRGNATRAYECIIRSASAKAREKIENAGGRIVAPSAE